jgi:hypothetical protein
MSTYTTTFTKTDAQKLAAKVGADLKQLQLFYGKPADAHIASYIEELVLFLTAGYLRSMDYAFARNGVYVVGVSYEVNTVSGTLVDNNPGRIPAGKDITGATFSTYRRPSSTYLALSSEQREAFDNIVPVKRHDAPDPLSDQVGAQDKTYSAGGQQLKRTTFN